MGLLKKEDYAPLVFPVGAATVYGLWKLVPPALLIMLSIVLYGFWKFYQRCVLCSVAGAPA